MSTMFLNCAIDMLGCRREVGTDWNDSEYSSRLCNNVTVIMIILCNCYNFNNQSINYLT